MNKNRIFTSGKMCAIALVGAGALMLASCAEDGFTEEQFVSSVTNSKLTNPELTFGSQVNSDGKQGYTFVVPFSESYKTTGFEGDGEAIRSPSSQIVNADISSGAAILRSRIPKRGL